MVKQETMPEPETSSGLIAERLLEIGSRFVQRIEKKWIERHLPGIRAGHFSDGSDGERIADVSGEWPRRKIELWENKNPSAFNGKFTVIRVTYDDQGDEAPYLVVTQIRTIEGITSQPFVYDTERPKTSTLSLFSVVQAIRTVGELQHPSS